MKPAHRRPLLGFALSLFLLMLLPAASGQITLQINIDQFLYPNFPALYALDLWISSPSTPITYDQVSSPTGLWVASIGNGGNNTSQSYETLDPVLAEMTNGIWTLTINGGDPSTQTNYFTVSVNDVTTNDLPLIPIVYPTNGAIDVPAQPLCLWSDPSGFTNVTIDVFNQDYSVYNGTGFGFAATNWTPPVPLNWGYAQMSLNLYQVTTNVVLSTPTNLLGQAMTNWTGIGGLHDSDYSTFFVGEPPPLVARYTFDDTNNLGNDSSPNNNYINSYGGFLGAAGVASTNFSVEGGEALALFGGSWMYLPTPVLQSLEGSFSVALWLATTNNGGDPDNDSGYNGAGIIAAADGTNDCLPMVQTGNKLAFYTGDTQTTLHSTHNIDTGSFVHLVVTRDATTGRRAIYLNGRLDAQDLAETTLLTNSIQGGVIGYNFDGYNGFIGVLDDVQFYDADIGASNALYLYSNPGSIITNLPSVSMITLGQALGETNLTWTSSGDSPWITEVTNTYNNLPAAAASGPVINDQMSVLQTTITGPGQITFWWQSLAADNDFDLEFDLDGNYWDDISGVLPWVQEQPFSIGPGEHTLSWTAYANGSTNASDAGFLDGLSISSGTPPEIISITSNAVFYAFRTAALQVQAAGDPSPDYNWQVQGYQPIGLLDTNTLIMVQAVTNYNADVFSVIVSNAVGVAQSPQFGIVITNDPSPPNPSALSQVSGNGGGASLAQVAATDAAGNVIISGSFTGTNLFGTNVLVGSNTLFLAKYDQYGDCLWATNIGGGVANNANILTIGPSGDILLGGSYQGAATFDSFVLTNAGSFDAYWARFNSNGACLIARRFGGTGSDFVQGISEAADGSVYIAGEGDSTTLGTNALSGAGSGILAKYNSAGQIQWLIATGGSGFAIGDDVRVIGTNVIFAGGQALGITFAGFEDTNTGSDTFLAGCDTNGNCAWFQSVGARDPVIYSYVDFPRLAAGITSNQFYLGGQTYGLNAHFGNFAFTSAPGRNTYVARFDTGGNCQMAQIFGNTNTFVAGVGADPSGNIYVAGTFTGPTDFDGRWLMNSRGPAYSPSDLGLFAASYNSVGALNWAWGTEAYTTGGAVAYDVGLAVVGDNSLYVASTLTNASFYGLNQLYAASGSTSAIITKLGIPGLPVSLAGTKLTATNLTFSFTTESSHQYFVQQSTNLAAGSWVAVTNILGIGTMQSVAVPREINGPAVFYRVQTQ